MALINYFLVALIGASGVGTLLAKPVSTLGPEALVQPNGGALVASQEEPKKDGGGRRGTLTANYTRYKKRGHGHSKRHSTVKHRTN